MNAFSRRHPLINFIFFALVLSFTIFTEHPLIVTISLFIAAFFSFRSAGADHFFRQLFLLLPLMLFAALLNPLISHQGETVLFRFPWGSDCTLEAVLYGVFAAARLAAVLLWFACWNRVITTDKFMYLFDGIFPALSLILSMGLHFVPRFLRRMREVSQAQKVLDPQNKGIRHAGRVISAVTTWSLENALETAESMKSRGYGLAGKTKFSLYRFTGQDMTALLLFLLLGAVILCGRLTGCLAFSYYPAVSGNDSVWTFLTAAAFGIFACYPLLLDGKEALLWRLSQSKI